MSLRLDQGKHIAAERLFSIRSVDDLAKYCTDETYNDALTLCLQRYGLHWLNTMNLPSGTNFNPTAFLAKDLSAIYYGYAPVIFLGSNEWAIKASKDIEFLSEKLRHFRERIRHLVARTDAKICFVVIPEKDYVIDYLAGRYQKIGPMRAAMRCLATECKDAGQGFIFDEFLGKLPDWASHDEYIYPDSHLLTRDYFLILKIIMEKFNINPTEMSGRGLFELGIHFGDLAHKFDPEIADTHYAIKPNKHFSRAVLIDGSQTFESPLGSTYQKFVNYSAPIDARVSIFGDSHSSIFAEKRLAFMASSIFRETNFYWKPWSVDPDDSKTDADFLIMEISQRFLFS